MGSPRKAMVLGKGFVQTAVLNSWEVSETHLDGAHRKKTRRVGPERPQIPDRKGELFAQSAILVARTWSGGANCPLSRAVWCNFHQTPWLKGWEVSETHLDGAHSNKKGTWVQNVPKALTAREIRTQKRANAPDHTRCHTDFFVELGQI